MSLCIAIGWPNCLAPIACAEFDDQTEIVPASDFRQGDAIRHLTVKVHGQHRFRTRCDPRTRSGDIQIVGTGVDIDIDRARAYQRDGLRSRAERKGRGDDLIAGADAACDEREHQRIRARGNANAKLRSAGLAISFSSCDTTSPPLNRQLSITLTIAESICSFSS